MSKEKYNLENIDVNLFEEELEYDEEVDNLDEIEEEASNYLNLDYKVVLYKDKEEGLWIAEHPELLGCKTDGETKEEALGNLEEAKCSWIYSRLAMGQNIPLPQNVEEQSYSGKILLRLPKDLHAILAKKAKMDNISLNQELIFLISNALGNNNQEDKLEVISSKLNDLTAKIDNLAYEKDIYSPSDYLENLTNKRKSVSEEVLGKFVSHIEDDDVLSEKGSMNIFKFFYKQDISMSSH
ncbi:type II toxin-antitoxin system HicB family antitoxin [Bacillus inaquosorum]|uniref:type II toxin-antitoxin system HicB family antitoxin n=1 Tax=Bacillus inaquosorum TaxID=483913 RepID=UPI0022831CC0|nr:type II toxin-antitoxin system HicB family antitoxin [Bacillus inaquosorum]MCY8061614.1 type II toxin-antitoxin system HicB family antitoxin [Bacillus spizizenii]MCY8729449.1 type II toxin-antitoxin system HicB family antitoxin [Bacillus inaquosorum]